MPETQSAAPSSYPYLATGLTFLLLGIGFANPYPLVLSFPKGMWDGELSLQALNLYALTTFLGWGHFFYAWQGQWRGSSRLPAKMRFGYWAAVLVLLVVLFSLRSIAGVGVFSLVTWVYNIGHFIKAERFFGRAATPLNEDAAPHYQLPAIAFAWFTLVLFKIGPMADARVVFAGTISLAALALILGDWRALSVGQMKLPLLTFFFLGETLVWNAYGPTNAFAVGVYVMHVAAASFYHYLSGYFYAQRGASTPPLLRPWCIVGVNAAFLTIGIAVARVPALWPLQILFGPQWFTLWVALHLVASDLLPIWKNHSLTAQSPPAIVHA